MLVVRLTCIATSRCDCSGCGRSSGCGASASLHLGPSLAWILSFNCPAYWRRSLTHGVHIEAQGNRNLRFSGIRNSKVWNYSQNQWHVSQASIHTLTFEPYHLCIYTWWHATTSGQHEAPNNPRQGCSMKTGGSTIILHLHCPGSPGALVRSNLLQ